MLAGLPFWTVPMQGVQDRIERRRGSRSPERLSKNRALVVSQQCGLVDRPMVMEQPPRAMYLDEPSGCTNSKLKPNEAVELHVSFLLFGEYFRENSDHF